MIGADDFLAPARAKGFDFFTGVPCSFLTSLINRVITDEGLDYLGAASEGEAIAIASGAWLAGRRTVAMCQNSGLGNMVNPLTSLNFPFRIPTLLIVTWRGEPGIKDEPQHELMGEITADLLATLRIPHGAFPTEAADINDALADAEASLEQSSLPYAFIMAGGSVAEEDLKEPACAVPGPGTRQDFTNGGVRPKRIEVLENFLEHVPEGAAVVASTGKCGRELFTLADRAQHLYQVGSMGCAAGMGLGIAVNVARPVVVLDGDGAALMKMGTLATIGAQGPHNLIHIILDNGVHDSTGGQATVSASVDFAAVALACGYQRVALADNLSGFTDAFAAAVGSPGPHLIHARIQPGSIGNLGRPTISPPEVARRFKHFLTG
ncbi:MAG: phosphonopyruvate decarboxylase [Alphaproteobacteria bacterium]